MYSNIGECKGLVAWFSDIESPMGTLNLYPELVMSFLCISMIRLVHYLTLIHAVYLLLPKVFFIRYSTYSTWTLLPLQVFSKPISVNMFVMCYGYCDL